MDIFFKTSSFLCSGHEFRCIPRVLSEVNFKTKTLFDMAVEGLQPFLCISPDSDVNYMSQVIDRCNVVQLVQLLLSTMMH